jgi:hypothetical protein
VLYDRKKDVWRIIVNEGTQSEEQWTNELGQLRTSLKSYA